MNYPADLSDAAINCATPIFFDNPTNSGSMEAHGRTTSTATVININRRKTPRKIPGVAESPKRGYIVTDRKLVGGNLIARDMLGHLRYWLEPDESGKPRSKRFHEGHYWEACSLKFWEQQLGCSRQEARTAIKALEKSGAVVRDVRPFGNWETEHYRLVLEVCGIKLRDTSTASMVAANHTCVASNTTLVASNTATSLKLHLEVTKAKNNTYKHADEKTSAGNTNVKGIQAEAGETKPKATATPETTPDAPVESGKSKPKTNPAPSPGSAAPPSPKSEALMPHYEELAKRHDMGVLLALLVDAGYLSGDRTMLSDPECSMLDRIEYALEHGALNNTTLEGLISWAARDNDGWDTVVEWVAYFKPLKAWPSHPNLAFLTKHIDVLGDAYTLMLAQEAEEAAEQTAERAPPL